MWRCDVQIKIVTFGSGVVVAIGASRRAITVAEAREIADRLHFAARKAEANQCEFAAAELARGETPSPEYADLRSALGEMGLSLSPAFFAVNEIAGGQPVATVAIGPQGARIRRDGAWPNRDLALVRAIASTIGCRTCVSISITSPPSDFEESVKV
ncbi:MAG TPA: hypothetical protein VIJ12_02540 [Candidatus Baltobacteraceae bacterium]